MPRARRRRRFFAGRTCRDLGGQFPEWALIEFGAALAGVTLVTVNPAYLANELAFVLKQSQRRAFSCRRATGIAT